MYIALGQIKYKFRLMCERGLVNIIQFELLEKNVKKLTLKKNKCSIRNR